jgi:PleD family two-component response regulator
MLTQTSCEVTPTTLDLCVLYPGCDPTEAIARLRAESEEQGLAGILITWKDARSYRVEISPYIPSGIVYERVDS